MPAYESEALGDAPTQANRETARHSLAKLHTGLPHTLGGRRDANTGRPS